MKHHIEFMEAFLAGLRSLPNPDKYTEAYIRAFEMCLMSARKNQHVTNTGGIQDVQYMELPINAR
jgi:hypothetical protein